MSAPKPSSPTQIYIYPSCLGLVGSVTHPAPTIANGSAGGVTSQVLAQVASLLDNDFVAETGKIIYFFYTV